MKIYFNIEGAPSELNELLTKQGLAYFLSGNFQADMNALLSISRQAAERLDTLPDILSQEKRMADQLTDLDAQQAAELAELTNLTGNIGTLATLFNTLAAAATSSTPVDVSKEIAQGAQILNGLQAANAQIAAALSASTGSGNTGGGDTTPAAPVVPPVPEGPASPDPTVVPGGAVTAQPANDGAAPVITGTDAPATPTSDDAKSASVAAADTLTI